VAEENRSELLLIGLGNPGPIYTRTRHNLGFLIIDELAHSLGWKLKEVRQFRAKVAKGELNEAKVHLMQPMTYMNESGWPVRQYLDYYGLLPSQIVVICDDIALEFGRMRLRIKGSAGGHNGLKSIIAHLETQEFMRLRMGIGDYRDKEHLSDYVLNSFTAEESAVLDEFVRRGAMALRDLTLESTALVMNRINQNLTQ
jgi:peptidyl-tRNA hydrolase, PTH1 family